MSLCIGRDEEVMDVRERSHDYRVRFRTVDQYCNPPELIYGNIEFMGIDMGGKIERYDGVQLGENGCIILKVAGHAGWYAIGTTKYCPPKYLIGQMSGFGVDDKQGVFHCRWEVCYTRKFQKKAKEEAVKLMKTLKCK